MYNFAEPQNICRICLAQNNKETQSVFDTIDSTGESHKISEMLMACAKVEIYLGDEKPDKICSKCAQDTIKLYSFKTKCEESDKTLRNRFKKGTFIVIDKIDVDEEGILDKVKLDVKQENDEASDVLKDIGDCGYCAQQNEYDPLETIVYEDYDAYKSPKYSESNTFNNIKTENTILLVEESNYLNKFPQDAVSQGSSKSSLLAKHDFIASGKKLYKCDVCEKKFSTSAFLLNHKRIHTGEKLYECDLCKKKFKLKNSLMYHLRKHIREGEKLLKCDICEKKFAKQFELVNHKRVHTGNQPYQCDICETRFYGSRSLDRHKRWVYCDKKVKKSASVMVVTTT